MGMVDHKRNNWLKETFLSLVSGYTNDQRLINECWKEIEHNYSNKKRRYHTLGHLENLFVQLEEVKDEINHWETILFTLYYHDIIYNALKSDNEEKSAELAEKRMKQLSVPIEMINACKAQILATKKHLDHSASDTNYFTDADLSVLGQEWEIYEQYYKNVRKEYAVYPNVIYNPGRKKVLNHFLNMEKIYKTAYFNSKFESQAKLNLKREMDLL